MGSMLTDEFVDSMLLIFQVCAVVVVTVQNVKYLVLLGILIPNWLAFYLINKGQFIRSWCQRSKAKNITGSVFKKDCIQIYNGNHSFC